MSSPLKRLAGAAGARIAVLPITALASLAISRSVSTDYSIDVFAIFMLAYTIPALLPSFDFGLGAPVTTAAARLEDAPENFKWVFLRATRWLLLASILISVVSFLLTLNPGITTLLGVADRSYDSAFLISLLLIALAISTGLGPALLLGLKKNTLLTILQGASGPMTLAIVNFIVAAGGSSWWIVALAPAGLVISNLTIFIIAMNSSGVKRALTGEARSGQIVGTALPMLVILVATPIAIQSGRVALSWTADLNSVAAYAAAFTLFGPAYSVGQIAGRSLWPEFVAISHDRRALLRLFRRSLLVCAVVGAALSAGFVIIAPWAISIIFPPDMRVSWATWWAMGLAIFIISVHQPAAMLLTDSRGLRIQALFSVVLAITVLSATILLAQGWQDAAPAISLALGFTLCQFFPVLIAAWRQVQAGGTSW